jgi:1,2-diacylglycerol 3-beta-glucosyltransferase
VTLPLAGVAAWALALPVAGISIYMLGLVLGSWLYRPGGQAPSALPAVAVIVPAHDEEGGIGATIATLLAADYPRELLRIFVIADNCTDRTADVAREMGVEVLERQDAVNRGKGQALDWMLRQQGALLKDAALLAFIDADMQVERGFFRAMAAAFSAPGLLAAQGRYVIANADRSVLAAIGYVSFCYVNHVRPAGRSFWGGTADLKGSGMMFRAPFLLQRGWSAHSIAEDIQLGKELMLEGIRVAYVPEARVASDIPATLTQVTVQQSRWEGGRHEVHASVLPRAWRAVRDRPSGMLLDGVLDLLVPPLSVVILLNLLGLAMAWWAGSGAAMVFAASLAVFGGAVVSGLIQNRAPGGVWWRLVAAPAFIAWKLVLLLRLALAPRTRAWQRTPRNPKQP